MLAILSATDPASGMLSATAAGSNPQVELNPFGTLITVIAWTTLVGINLWCFRKALMHKPEKDSMA
ncbi:MAG: hypothetical protein QM477_00115 [Planctomycetota bacterium]